MNCSSADRYSRCMIENIIQREPYTSVLYNADCREYMRSFIATDWAIGSTENGRKFDLIFADPPFNQGEAYSEWNDKQSFDDFWKFTWEWLQLASQLLAPNGNLWLNVPDSMAVDVIFYLREQLVLRDWCIWHYRFGQCTPAKFISSKVHALHFIHQGCEDSYIWNPLDVLVNSDRASVYADSRTWERSDTSLIPVGKRLPFDVWSREDDGGNWGRVQGNNAERVPSQANQLPEKYIERVVRSSSNPGSWVLDLFAGSGTVGAVCKALNRNCVMCEIGTTEAQHAIERIKKGAVRC